MWKDFLEIYGQFWHVPSERFASPNQDPSTQQMATLFIPNYSEFPWLGDKFCADSWCVLLSLPFNYCII